jgi:hypothetical protein
MKAHDALSHCMRVINHFPCKKNRDYAAIGAARSGTDPAVRAAHDVAPENLLSRLKDLTVLLQMCHGMLALLRI